jgi:hypothetical protein
MQEIVTTEFSRNVILLLLGGLLTGILVPVIKSVIDWGSAKRQKTLEAQLSRQKEIIDSQIAFLTQFSDLTWKFIFELFKVSYAFAWEKEQTQQATYESYGAKSWELLCTIRGCISAGTRLTSPATQRELRDLYDWFIELDDQVCVMADDRRPQQDWRKFHLDNFMSAGDRLDSTIARLSKDLKLSLSHVSGSKLTIGGS